jgi:hypothetical protein
VEHLKRSHAYPQIFDKGEKVLPQLAAEIEKLEPKKFYNFGATERFWFGVTQFPKFRGSPTKFPKHSTKSEENGNKRVHRLHR